MASKNDQEKKRILNKAGKLFFSYGYSKITMDELAGELKMSKKTIYRFFPSKKILLDEVIKNYFEEFQEEMDHQLESNLSFRMMVKNFLLIIHQKSACFDVRALEDIKKNNPDSWKKLDDYRETIVKTRLKKIFQRGIAEGVVKNDLSLEVIVLITTSAIHNIAVPEVLTNLPYSFEQTLDMILEIIIEGIIVREE